MKYITCTATLGVVILLAAAVHAPAAENDGAEELDKATQAKLTATTFKDLSEVISLLDAAIEKGLDESNQSFAEDLLAATLVQRASATTEAALHGNLPGRGIPQVLNMAMTDLKRAIELDDQLAQAHFLLGRLLAAARQRDEALESLTAAINSERADVELKSQALILRGNLQTDDAKRLADYDQAIKLVPEDVNAIRSRALFHLVKGKFDLAIADLDQALELDPDHAGTHEARGVVALGKRQFDQALDSFNKAIELAPESASTFWHRARTHVAMNDGPAALADLDKVLALQPKSVDALLLRSQLRQQSGDTENALDDVQEALSLKPGHAPAVRLRAAIHAGADQIEEAIAELEKLAEVIPDDRHLLFQLGTYYSSNHQLSKAIETFTSVLEQQDNHWLALRMRGDAQLRSGHHAGAIADFDAALKLSPDDDSILNNLAWVLCTSPDDSLRDGKRAVELATKACEVTGYEKFHILSTLAAAYAETGDFQTAIEWSEKAVELGKGDDQYQQLVDELESYRNGKPSRELLSDSAPSEE